MARQTTFQGHTFRAARLANGIPTLVCRVCGEFFDHEAHRAAAPPEGGEG